MSGAGNCCMGCSDRRVGCHGRCERYAAWKAAEAARTAPERAARAREQDSIEYVRGNILRTNRRFGRK